MRAQWPFRMYSLRKGDEQNANDFQEIMWGTETSACMNLFYTGLCS